MRPHPVIQLYDLLLTDAGLLRSSLAPALPLAGPYSTPSITAERDLPTSNVLTPEEFYHSLPHVAGKKEKITSEMQVHFQLISDFTTQVKLESSKEFTEYHWLNTRKDKKKKKYIGKIGTQVLNTKPAIYWKMLKKKC